jgi:hypothetical protein
MNICNKKTGKDPGKQVFGDQKIEKMMDPKIRWFLKFPEPETKNEICVSSVYKGNVNEIL